MESERVGGRGGRGRREFFLKYNMYTTYEIHAPLLLLHNVGTVPRVHSTRVKY